MDSLLHPEEPETDPSINRASVVPLFHPGWDRMCRSWFCLGPWLLFLLCRISATSEDQCPPKDLSWLLWPLDREEFWKNSWETQPVLIRRDQPDYYADLFSMEAVAAIIDQFKTNLKVNDDFGAFHDNFYTPREISNASMLYDAYLSGQTVSIFSIQQRNLRCCELCQEMAADLGYPFRMNLYMTPGASVDTGRARGFAPHSDCHDIFVLQIEGEKTWKVYNPQPGKKLNTRPLEVGKVQDGAPVLKAPEDTGEPIVDTTLRPGDALYVPRGFVHEAFTQTDSGSLHLTFRCIYGHFFRWGRFIAYGFGIDPNLEVEGPSNYDLELRKAPPPFPMQEIEELVCRSKVRHDGTCKLRRRWKNSLLRACSLAPNTDVRKTECAAYLAEEQASKFNVTFARDIFQQYLDTVREQQQGFNRDLTASKAADFRSSVQLGMDVGVKRQGDTLEVVSGALDGKEPAYFGLQVQGSNKDPIVFSHKFAKVSLRYIATSLKQRTQIAVKEIPAADNFERIALVRRLLSGRVLSKRRRKQTES